MLAFVFPGQGAQSVGMVDALAAEFPQVASRFEQASSVLGFDLWSLVATGPAAQLNSTTNTQPALLAASVATWDVWRSLGGPDPAMMAGHSFGEYSALVCGGALEFEDAVSLVAARGRFMQEATPVGAGTMAAVLGLERAELEQACAAASVDGAVQCANLNAPGQIVISGSVAGVEKASVLAKAAGAKKVIPLAVSVPAHSILMRSAAERFEQLLSEVRVSVPGIKIIHNVDVAPCENIDEIKSALVRQLYSPVRWQETIELFAHEGVTQCVECGPGKVLGPLVRRCVASLEMFSLGGPAEIRGALAALGVDG